MSLNLTENCHFTTAINSSSEERFIVFVAGGTHPIVSYQDFSRAECVALAFAGLVNARMEVFDSLKEICYFVDPHEAIRPFIH